MNLTELSVIVPTRNEEKNIPRFLASVPEAVELIVVDASDDRTVEILKRERRGGRHDWGIWSPLESDADNRRRQRGE